MNNFRQLRERLDIQRHGHETQKELRDITRLMAQFLMVIWRRILAHNWGPLGDCDIPEKVETLTRPRGPFFFLSVRSFSMKALDGGVGAWY